MERAYAFGPYRFDPAGRLLTRDGESVRLTPKSADLLLALIRAEGRVVSKDILIRDVWSGAFVEDGTLTFHIHLLRQALGESAETPTYIATVPKRGYRFIWPVAQVSLAPPGVPSPVVDPQPVLVANLDAPAPLAETTIAPTGRNPAQPLRASGPVRHWRLPLTGVVIVLFLAAATSLGFALQRSRPIRVIQVTQLTHDGLPKSHLLPLDRNRLLVTVDGMQREFHADTGALAGSPFLESYDVVDVSQARGEALATRPHDKGGERGLWAVRLDGTGARRLGMIQFIGVATWSHDGQRIAYSDNHAVNVTDADGGAVRTLATFTGAPNALAWARDDDILRVLVANAADRALSKMFFDVPSHDARRTLSPMALRIDPPDLLDGPIFWMPASTDFVFATSSASGSQIWALSGEGLPFFRRQTLRRLTPAGDRIWYFSPTPSPDGTRIYALGHHTPELSVFDEGKHRFAPFLGGIPAFAVRFSPDRQFVVYIDALHYTLWRAHADGSDAHPLTSAAWYVDSVVWRPDGKGLAIRARTPGRHSKVYLMGAGGGTPEPLDHRDVEQGSPTWSPDGTRLAFGDVPERYGDPTGSERIHIHDLQTEQMTDLPGSVGLWSSRWSPDGRYLAATRIVDRKVMLYTFATGRWRELDVTHADDLVWTPDSRFVYGDPERGAGSAVRIRVADGRVEPVVDLTPFTIARTGAGLSLDGRPLFLRVPMEIYALDVERR